MRRLTALLTTGVAALGLVVAGCDLSALDSSHADTGDYSPYAGDYDFIIVGSGAGGGPLGANLARAGFKVLMLEAGGDATANTVYKVPAFHAASTEARDMRWDYYVKHNDDPATAVNEDKQRDTKFAEHGLDGEDLTKRFGEGGILYPRAGTLGGCTAHNANIVVLPEPSDFDGYATQLGDPSWGGAAMRHYFEAAREWLPVSRPTIGAFANILGHGIADLVPRVLLPAMISAVPGFPVKQQVDNMANILGRDLNQMKSENALAGKRTTGMFYFPMQVTNPSTRDSFGKPVTPGERRGPANYILDTRAYLEAQRAQGLPAGTLDVRLNSLVTKVLFARDAQGALVRDADGKPVANGVMVRQQAHAYVADPAADLGDDNATELPATVKPGGEVILAAGAFNTPQLLMLSGIGAKDELAAVGIEPLVDLPGVGKNLQDRYEVGVTYKFDQRFAGVLGNCTFGQPGDPCLADWQKDPGFGLLKSLGSNLYSTNGSIASILLRSQDLPGEPVASGTMPDEPDLHLFGVLGQFKGYYPNYAKNAVDGVVADGNLFTWIILKGETGNHAGTVRLRSSDPRQTPEINFHSFGDNGDADLEAVVRGIEWVRNMGIDAHEKIPADLIRNPAAEDVEHDGDVSYDLSQDDRTLLKQFVKNEAWGHHACCSDKLGADGDPMAVLDQDFRVRGVAGLRVVDASVFPDIPGTFIYSSILMISEKAADVIIRQHGGVGRLPDDVIGQCQAVAGDELAGVSGGALRTDACHENGVWTTNYDPMKPASVDLPAGVRPISVFYQEPGGSLTEIDRASWCQVSGTTSGVFGGPVNRVTVLPFAVDLARSHAIPAGAAIFAAYDLGDCGH